VAKHVRGGSKIYDAIRESILRLELRPGSVIDEAALAESINVSRTPVREAIIQLIADDLVIRDGRTARVAPLDFDEISKLYDALTVSSRMIHRLAAENRSDADLRKIKSAMLAFEQGISKADGLARSELNIAFHLCISAAAKNTYFEDFYEKILFATNRLARACFAESLRGEISDYPDDDLSAHMTETVRQHRLMYDAIVTRNLDDSDELALMHVTLAKGRLQKALFRTARSVDRGLVDIRQSKAPD